MLIWIKSVKKCIALNKNKHRHDTSNLHHFELEIIENHTIL